MDVRAPISRLPVDIFDMCLNELNPTTTDGRRALYSCSLVSKSWRRATMPYLFHNLRFTCDKPPLDPGIGLSAQEKREFARSWKGSELWPLYRRLVTKPELRDWVRVLRLDSGEFKEACTTGRPYPFPTRKQNYVKEKQFIAILQLLPYIREMILGRVIITRANDGTRSAPLDTGVSLRRLQVTFDDVPKDTSPREGDLGVILGCFKEVDVLSVQGYRGSASRLFEESGHGCRVKLRALHDTGSCDWTPLYSAIAESPALDTLRKLSVSPGPGESYPQAASLNALLKALGGNLVHLDFRPWAMDGMSDDEGGRIRLTHCTGVRNLDFDVQTPFPWRFIARLLETLPETAAPRRIDFQVFPVFKVPGDGQWSANTEDAASLDMALARLRNKLQDLTVAFHFAASKGPHKQAFRDRFGGDFYRLCRTGSVELVFE